MTKERARAGYKLTHEQKMWDGFAIMLSRTKTAKELQELLRAAETSKHKAVVRLAIKLRREQQP